jgi:hypothetical protein
MIGQTKGAGHVMNYSVDGSVFLVINPCFIPCNNALRKFLSLIGVRCQVHGGTVPRVLSSCEVLWHQKCTHFPVFQLAVNGATRTTQRNALLSQVHVICPL